MEKANNSRSMPASCAHAFGHSAENICFPFHGMHQRKDPLDEDQAEEPLPMGNNKTRLRAALISPSRRADRTGTTGHYASNRGLFADSFPIAKPAFRFDSMSRFDRLAP